MEPNIVGERVGLGSEKFQTLVQHHMDLQPWVVRLAAAWSRRRVTISEAGKPTGAEETFSLPGLKNRHFW